MTDRKNRKLLNTTLEIFSFADKNNLTTQQAAIQIAENKIAERKKKTLLNKAFSKKNISYFCKAKDFLSLC